MGILGVSVCCLLAHIYCAGSEADSAIGQKYRMVKTSWIVRCGLGGIFPIMGMGWGVLIYKVHVPMIPGDHVLWVITYTQGLSVNRLLLVHGWSLGLFCFCSDPEGLGISIT